MESDLVFKQKRNLVKGIGSSQTLWKHQLIELLGVYAAGSNAVCAIPWELPIPPKTEEPGLGANNLRTFKPKEKIFKKQKQFRWWWYLNELPLCSWNPNGGADRESKWRLNVLMIKLLVRSPVRVHMGGN